jgi:hypothetical protein
MVGALFERDAVRSPTLPRQAKSRGSITFSSAVSVGRSWKNWNTIPTVSPRQPARSFSLKSLRSRPATLTLPLVTLSIPVMTFRIVDFPLPLGPTIATISPGSTFRWTPRSAGNSTRPAR